MTCNDHGGNQNACQARSVPSPKSSRLNFLHRSPPQKKQDSTQPFSPGPHTAMWIHPDARFAAGPRAPPLLPCGSCTRPAPKWPPGGRAASTGRAKDVAVPKIGESTLFWGWIKDEKIGRGIRGMEVKSCKLRKAQSFWAAVWKKHHF